MARKRVGIQPAQSAANPSSIEGYVMGLAITAKRLVAMPGEQARRLSVDGGAA